MDFPLDVETRQIFFWKNNILKNYNDEYGYYKEFTIKMWSRNLIWLDISNFG